MSTWYEQAVFYHIYPLGLTGAPRENPVTGEERAASARFEALMFWIPHMKDLNCTAVYIGPLFDSSGPVKILGVLWQTAMRAASGSS